ncbi:hypothetical protein pb186bvf_004547 [Paramecium bursaria]
MKEKYQLQKNFLRLLKSNNFQFIKFNQYSLYHVKDYHESYLY